MTGGKPGSDEKKARLARALKANLARRKAQAREREAAGEAPEGEENGCPN